METLYYDYIIAFDFYAVECRKSVIYGYDIHKFTSTYILVYAP